MITDLDVRQVTALGDGVSVNHTLNFAFQDNDDVEVWVYNTTTRALTQLVYGSGAGKFTITGGDPGTTVVMGTALSTTEKAVIRRVKALTQTVDLVATEAFPADDTEELMDKIVMLLQQLRDETKRALKFTIASSQVDIPLPEPDSGKYLRWNDDGTALENASATELESSVNALATKTVDFTVDAEDDEVLLVDASAAAVTATLPTAIGNTGKRLAIKKIDSTVNLVVVAPFGSQTIEGQATQTLSNQYETLTIISDGTGWYIV